MSTLRPLSGEFASVETNYFRLPLVYNSSIHAAFHRLRFTNGSLSFMRTSIFAVSWLVLSLQVSESALCQVSEATLAAAGKNRPQIEEALVKVPVQQRGGIEFLVQNMPARDLTSLSAEYLLKNTRLAYQSWRDDPWAKNVPKEIFLNNVLPYASINERRDNWRGDLRQRFLPLVKQAKTTGEATTILNREIFKQLGVKFSTNRKKADQSPYETIEDGMASCTGLSVLLIDACRSVGVPARMVGTPLWTNKSGNHSWVEVWDDGWQFTGAAEATGEHLNRGWFVNRAATAIRDNPLHAIYATSFKKTPLSFPCVWDRRITYVPAVNVTDRYVALIKELPAGHVQAMFVVRDKDGQRVSASLRITQKGQPVFVGVTNDDRFDPNDHICVPLMQGQEFLIEVEAGDHRIRQQIKPSKQDEMFSLQFASATNSRNDRVDEDASGSALKSLRNYLQLAVKDRPPLNEQDFAGVALTDDEVVASRETLAKDRIEQIRADNAEEMKSRVLKHGEQKMPFFFKQFGKKPADGWSLYISLHGGGGAPPRVNDQQWENQKRLYSLDEGIYLVPRAPTNTWNLWHQGHIDPLFDRLIENMVAFEGVNWNRVYVMGYSAGGDGVYQLAPRMADRWAAAAMMAGHPNETSALGIRNVPFALQVGGRDAAYNRNKVAAAWQKRLAQLRKDDPDGYLHFVKIYPEKGHWMDREDAVAIPWMAKQTRNAAPKRIVWKQDDVTHSQFYWLGVDDANRKARSEVIAEAVGQTITLSAKNVSEVVVYLDDRFIDLDQPVKIQSEGKVLHEGVVPRTIATLFGTLSRRGDPFLSFPSAVTVSIPKPFPQSFVPKNEIPRYTAVRCEKPLVIDGKLNEEVWKSVQTTPPFVDLINGKETIHKTRAALVWDDEFLYVAFWIAEPNVEAKYKNRDDPIYYDNDTEIFIAGKDAYYEFEINAYGTVYEGFFVWEDSYERDGYGSDPQLKRNLPKSQKFNGVGFKNHPRGKRIAFLGYDFPNFKSAVHIDGTLNDNSDVDEGWTVELAFPWKEMNWLAKGDGRALPPKHGDKWQIDLFRFNTYKAPAPAVDSGGWALGKHGVWDSHIPEIFPIVTFSNE